MPTPTLHYHLLADVQQALTTLETTINAIDAEIKRLTALGIFAAIPRQVWEDKAGTDYLYLIFPSTSSGGYTGPNGKRKVYIGRKPNAVAKAEQMIARTAHVQALRNDMDRLMSHRSRILEAINNALYISSHTPKLSGPIPYHQ